MEDLKLAKKLLKALDMAIAFERVAQERYAKEAAYSYENEVKNLFKQLVSEELGHERILTRKKNQVIRDIAKIEKKR